MEKQQRIILIGPGGSGKSTVGALLGERLGVPFIDLDAQFVERAGDISEFINTHGYEAYAKENVEGYRLFQAAGLPAYVAALSSGFMTYPETVHPTFRELRRAVEQSPTTFVLIPSLDRDACVSETVRRQLARPFGRSLEREESVIRGRFSVYVDLPNQKFETMRPLTVIVDEILGVVR